MNSVDAGLTINASCTTGGPPTPGGGLDQLPFLPRCFDVRTLRKRSQTTSFV